MASCYKKQLRSQLNQEARSHSCIRSVLAAGFEQHRLSAKAESGYDIVNGAHLRQLTPRISREQSATRFASRAREACGLDSLVSSHSVAIHSSSTSIISDSGLLYQCVWLLVWSKRSLLLKLANSFGDADSSSQRSEEMRRLGTSPPFSTRNPFRNSSAGAGFPVVSAENEVACMADFKKSMNCPCKARNPDWESSSIGSPTAALNILMSGS